MTQMSIMYFCWHAVLHLYYTWLVRKKFWWKRKSDDIKQNQMAPRGISQILEWFWVNQAEPVLYKEPTCESVYYQSLIEVLRWALELGRVDICLEVSMMSSHVLMIRIGHLEQVLHIFSCLERNHNTERWSLIHQIQ